MLLKLVNAFSREVDSGNPAGVCIVEEFPAVEKMQEIATEINFSETAFVKKLFENNYYIRWFTPNSEAPFCIHATLASAHVLYENNLAEQSAEISFFNMQRELKISQEDGWISVNASSMAVEPQELNHTISTILKGYNVVYVGLSENVLFVELKHSSEVRNFIPKLDLIASLPYRALLITSKDEEYDFISRYFAPSVAINEDPVCGSGHCRLTPYWSKKLGKDKMIAYQASHRGGVIRCENLKNRVIISGQAVTLKKDK
ncbi:PhzF family phenazine biosynthesis protein [Candidatus Bandiella euplotis]|uniref:PhzF family protein n=1 Tax=Candidatus Bandiella euplotis TaxID=1664265 RepID=A0ABZ0UMF2_9RICK|nr:PhzF family phenazine biosynthesis protein [Candidatus Bandiella woodruffii]WPX95940.1 PhzF family protein [Candidatus Bandiella woodruffii]